MRKILISGASRGIGKAIAIRLLNEGHYVSLGIRDRNSLNNTLLDYKKHTSEKLIIHNYSNLSKTNNDLSDNYDLVIGSRYIKGISIVNWPLSRLILSYFANLYARVIIGIPIKDVTGGFKCISTNILRNINLNNIKSEGYSFQIELNYLAWINNYKIAEIPIIFTDRSHGSSKMSKRVIFEAIYMVPYLMIKKIFKL